MIPVSNATKQTIANGTVYAPSVDITLAGASTPISLTSADIWDGGIVIENAISNESSLDVGSVMISKATVTINNIDGTYDHTDFSDAVVAIYLTVGSETFSRGRYTVDTQTFNGGLVTLTCLDFMEKTERPASDLPTITYPTTIGTIVSAIASTCGLTLDDAQFTGYNFPITAAIDMANLSCRDVLHYLVQICGANAWMSYDNKLVIRWYEIAEDASADPTPGDTIFSYDSLPSGTVYTDGFSFAVGNTYILSFGNKLLSGTATGNASSREVEFADGTDRMVIVQLKNDYPQTYYTTEFRAYSSAFDNGFTVSEAVHAYAIPHPYALTAAIDKTVITGVRVIVNTDSDSETDPSTITYVSGTDDFAIQIESNPYINTDNYQAVAANIGANVVGLEYYRANASVIGNAILETGDIITISNRKGTAYPIIVSSVTYTVNDKTRIVSASEEPARNSANRLSEATKTYIRAREAALKPALTALDQAKDDLNARISASPGLYTTEVTDSQGATTFYLHDKSTLATSTIIWKMTAEAWGVSTNGGQSYDYGMTVDGNVIANILSANGVNADWINTGSLSIGGTGTAANGQIKIYDANGNLIGYWDKTGLHVYKGDIEGSTISVGNDSGLTGEIVIHDSTGAQIGTINSAGISFDITNASGDPGINIVKGDWESISNGTAFAIFHRLSGSNSNTVYATLQEDSVLLRGTGSAILSGDDKSVGIALKTSASGLFSESGLRIVDSNDVEHWLNKDDIDAIHNLAPTTWYGISDTAATTAEKAVVCDGFVYKEGSIIVVSFTNGSTEATPTLNVNSIGSKNIHVGGTTPNGTTNTLKWSAGTQLVFMCHDNAYRFLTAQGAGTTTLPQGAGVWYGTSSTAATTAAKTSAVTNFRLTKGAIVNITFTTANTKADAALTLNVNSTGAKTIYVNNAATSATNNLLWSAGETLTFVYSGSYYYFVGKSGSNIGTVVEASVGSSGTTAIPTGTTTNVATISLAPGTWIVHGRCSFNTGGTAAAYRGCYIGSSATGNQYGAQQQAGSSSGNTMVNAMAIVTLSSTSTIYLNAIQGSGGNLNLVNNQTFIKAVRVA